MTTSPTPSIVNPTPAFAPALAGAADWQPRIVALLCNWCSYTGADLAGISRLSWSPAVRIVRVMCSGRVDPTLIADAFRLGADGVIVSGCHPGDCHYQDGNRKALRRVHLLKKLLADFGIEPERLRLVWVSASEGARWAEITDEMESEIRRLGPLRWES
jgi:F420-non-reducing hydrogenase iron-sulfur subunit